MEKLVILLQGCPKLGISGKYNIIYYDCFAMSSEICLCSLESWHKSSRQRPTSRFPDGKRHGMCPSSYICSNSVLFLIKKQCLSKDKMSSDSHTFKAPLTKT